MKYKRLSKISFVFDPQHINIRPIPSLSSSTMALSIAIHPHAPTLDMYGESDPRYGLSLYLDLAFLSVLSLVLHILCQAMSLSRFLLLRHSLFSIQALLACFYSLSLLPLKANPRYSPPVPATRLSVSVQSPENLLLQSLQNFQTRKILENLVRCQYIYI